MNFSATFSQTTKGFDRSKTAASIEELRERVQWVLNNTSDSRDLFAALTAELMKYINDEKLNKIVAEFTVTKLIEVVFGKSR